MKEWKKYKIGELVDLSQGQVINAQTNHLVVKEGIPLLRITDMINGTKNIFIDSVKVSQKNVAKPEDIIYTRTGQVGLVFKKQFGVVHNNCFKVIPKNAALDRIFLYWFLKTKSIYEYVNAVASGSAQPDLPHGAFKSITICLPPLNTQQRIASILSVYDDLIEVNNQRIKLLEETARELYKEWFVRMRFPGYKKAKFVKGVPEGWEIKKVKDIVDRRKFGKTYKPEELSERGNVIVIDQSTDALLGFHDNYPDHIATSENPLIIFGDHTCKMQLMIESFSLAENVIPIAAKDKVSIYYLYYLIESLVETTEYKRHWNDLITKSVFVCHSGLQKRYAVIVKPFFEQIEILKKQNTQLRQIRDRLLPRLIGGKILVK